MAGRSRLTSRRAQRQLAEFYPFMSSRHMNEARREADRAVNHALYHGTLIRQKCEKCGSRKSEAHHEDYAKPLEVKWLCRYHHRHRDAELRDHRRSIFAEAVALPVVPVERKLRRSLVASETTVALVRQATFEIADAVDAQGVSENLLARRMNVSWQVINAQFASGFRTLKVLAAYADALGYDAVFVLRKRQESAVA